MFPMPAKVRLSSAAASFVLLLASALAHNSPVSASAPERFPYLAHDFLTSGPGLRPASSTWLMEQRFVKMGGTWFFPADDGMHGRELWRSDGTAAGTSMVADMCPGVCSGSPSSLVVFGNELMFAAWDGQHGVELWRSDGTGAGTRMVADLRPGPESSAPYYLHVHGSVVLFSADRKAEGREPWRSDGTANGTFLLADILPGPTNSNTGAMYSAAGYALFSARNTQGTNDLYRTDGSVAGTQQVVGFSPGGVNPGYEYGPNRWVSWGGHVYFPAQTFSEWELWRSDGTPSGTEAVTDFATTTPYISWPTVSQGKLFFTADDGTGSELWATDGSVPGTALVKDLETGVSQGNPRHLIDTPAGLLFAGNQSATGYTLWRSDGTEAGTVQVKEIVPGPVSGLVTGNLIWTQWEWQRVADRILFLAEQSDGSTERWVSDGTTSGTLKLSDAAGPNDSAVFRQTFASIESEVVILEGSVISPTLVRTDGVSTSAILQIDDFSSSYPHRITAIDERAYIRTTDSASPSYLQNWVRESDGTFALLATSAPAADALLDFPSSVPTRAGDRLYFSSNADPAEGLALYSTDLDFFDLTLVPTVEPRRNSPPFVLNDVFHFWGNPDPANGNNSTLLRLESATTPPQEVLGPTDYFSGSRRDTTESGERLYLPSFQGLWSIDGATMPMDHAPTLERATNLQILDDGSSSAPPVALSATEPATGREVQTFDPATGTVTLHEIRPGPEDGALEAIWTRQFGNIEPTFLTGEPYQPAQASAAAGSLYFFVGNDGLSGTELWATTADGPPFLVADIAPGAASSHPAALQSVGNLVFFRANNGIHGAELWVTDGLATGTLMLGDLRPGSASSLPQEFTAVDSYLLFSAYEEDHGRELWISDGSPAGTRRLADIAAGPGSSSPLSFVAQDDAVLFVANDGEHGFELWALDRPLVNDSGLLFGTGFEGANLSAWSREKP